MQVPRYIVFLITLIYPFFIYSQGYICAIGGGGENYNDWSDAPYSWIVQKSNFGKVIVLSVNDETNWIPDYFVSKGASSAVNLKINTRDLANSQAVYDSIVAASAIFIKGGDQYNYINYWKGTLTEDAIRAVWQRGGVVAGTSAGAMVLSEFIISAKYGSLTPESAISNPFSQAGFIEPDFLGLVPGTIFDTHFIERARQGRLLAQVVRLFNEGHTSVRGVGIDDRTALCISPNGKGVVRGSGAVSVFRADTLTRSIVSGTQYELENLLVTQMVAGWEYDFVNNTVSTLPPSARPFSAGNDHSFASNVYLTGGNYQQFAHTTMLTEIAQSAGGRNIMIFAGSTYLSQANSIQTVLQSAGATTEVVSYGAASETDTALISRLSQAGAVVFTGNDVTTLKPITLPGSTIGALLKTKFDLPGFISVFIGETSRLAGEAFADDLFTDQYAAYRGKMTLKTGLGALNGFSFGPLTFDNSTYHETRMSALLWSAFRGEVPTGMYEHGTGTYRFDPESSNIYYKGFPLFRFDFSEATLADSSTYRASNSIGPRQAVAFDRYRISASNNYSRAFNTTTGKFVDIPVSVKETGQVPSGFGIKVFPNPFNPETTILIDSPTAGFTTVTLHSITGEKLLTLHSGDLHSGTSRIMLNGVSLPSGVYFISVHVDGHTPVIEKVVLLK